MGYNLVQKVIMTHLLEESRGVDALSPGEAIRLKVDQTLTQDSTGTMVYLQLESMNISKINTEVSVAYVDHNMLQSGYENADDHAFIESVAAKYGIIYSKPGNGICHQLHLENFSVPGKTLIGSDSHTPTCGGMGMLAIGAGGLDVAIGMASGYYDTIYPKVIFIELKGKLRPWVSAKDIILKVLSLLGVSGGVNAVIEYGGEGVKSLSVPERATITNMGAELGATSSIFPSDDRTLDFLTKLGRAEAYKPLLADEDAVYDQRLLIDLDALVPMVAKPHSPDNVAALKSVEGQRLDQVAIGSCTNASYQDLMKVAAILKGRTIKPWVSLVISPGSSAILNMIAQNGALADMIAAGARLLEAGCGPCIGMGQAPRSGGVSFRTFNRNFPGRSGTKDALVYLGSPEAAAVSSLKGYISDPSATAVLAELGLDDSILQVSEPKAYTTVGSFWQRNVADLTHPVAMGPNIKPFPVAESLPETLKLKISLKTGDRVSTDDIMPSHAGLLPFRSNIPRLSEACFSGIDPDFPQRAKAFGTSAIIGGETYGQGSSREHAALVPLYLGVRLVVAKSFARIHRANLINAGILPLCFDNPADYEGLSQGDELSFENIHEGLSQGYVQVSHADGKLIRLKFEGSEREKAILKAGGALKYAALK